MRALLLILLWGLAGAAGAETVERGTLVDMPADTASAAPANLPRRSMTMAQVERRYGEPRRRHGPVGDPPITRWDYDGFRVFFEHKLVLHAVVPGNFPRISHRDELQR